ncbi:protein of unknown function DUF420 [Halorhabdus utahensis DSM 12940]|uniref:DUF420 domain-containing protein n=1 Tax=Halorhabdus utahensis (strain DSM 12940 / JCM 11049 / AX-2) TaxID=519442 RepID=C7NTD5_HALUD|nr:DUF420 domain-containing protein [Halorhabdus utahensis]ACV10857.1 protein of unknown function DUF420 [Halorhabdus utahensis DSM 12940]
MRSIVRRRTVELTVVLTVGSLALIFGVVGGVVPSSWLPHTAAVDVLAHVNAVLSVLALVSIGAGVLAVRRGDIDAHRRRMGAAFALFVAFLASYLYRITVAGTQPFTGPGVLEPVYLVILAVHVTLAIVCLPLLYYVLLLAAAYDRRELPETSHPRIGRIAAPLWAISFTLGLVVYVVLYIAPW